MDQIEQYVQVAVNSPFLGSLLTYSLFDKDICIPDGKLVEVPLGKRSIKGCVVNSLGNQLPKEMDKSKIKAISSLVETEISISKRELDLFKWVSNYYHYPLGPLIFDCLPKMMKRPRELSYIKGLGKELTIDLNPDQEIVYKQFLECFGSGFYRFLVHGVTGSGKSLIYIKAIQKVLKEGKSALFLLPEINLTAQFLEFFKEHIDAPIFSYHSSISNSDKFGLWKHLQENDEPKLIVGVRSSVFLPIKNLGIIVVDEEHDSSFKQEDRCSYNGRDVATKKCSIEEIPIILGSATPTLETYNNFKNKDQKGSFYFSLKERATKTKLPKISLIDLREKDSEEFDLWPLNKKIITKIEGALEKKEQVLVFINSLGYANLLQCRGCGYRFVCKNCSTSLKLFKNKNKISCQSCEYQEPIPEECPDCGNLKIHHKGFGTEKVQELLEKKLSDAHIERFDRDELTNLVKVEKRLKDFHEGKIDVLVGTQMLSKGHNFKKVNLVIILGIDFQLNYPDFRANERAYQTLTQVSGRSGRFGEDSEVVISSMCVDHDIFDVVKKHGFQDFYSSELEVRKDFLFPPFSKMATIYFSSKFKEEVLNACEASAKIIHFFIEKHFPSLELLGPRPALIEKRVNKFTWSLLLKGEQVNEIHNIIKSLKNNLKLHYSVSMKIDVDPYQLQ